MQSKENIPKVKMTNEIQLSESLALYHRTFRSQYQGQQGQIHTAQLLRPASGTFLHTKTNHNSSSGREKWWIPRTLYSSWNSL